MKIHEVAIRIPAGEAQLAVAWVFAVLGSQHDWDSGNLDTVAAVADAHPQGLPPVFDHDDDSVAFWREVG